MNEIYIKEKENTCKMSMLLEKMDNDLLLTIMEELIPKMGIEAKENLTNMLAVNKRVFKLGRDEDFVKDYKKNYKTWKKSCKDFVEITLPHVCEMDDDHMLLNPCTGFSTILNGMDKFSNNEHVICETLSDFQMWLNRFISLNDMLVDTIVMETEFGTMEQVCDIFANIMNHWSKNLRITNQLSKIIYEMIDWKFLASTVFYNNTKLKTGIIRAFVNDTLTHSNIGFNSHLKDYMRECEEREYTAMSLLYKKWPYPIYTIDDQILKEMEIADQGI